MVKLRLPTCTLQRVRRFNLSEFYSSEYSNNYATQLKGEKVMPAWISNFEKVTINGTEGGNRA